MANREPIINDSTPNDQLFVPVIDGEPKAHGLVPRDFSAYPPQMFAALAPPGEMKLIPRSEMPARIKEAEDTKSRISDLLLTGDNGKPIPSLDQGSNGYCWGHSTVGCVQALRAINGSPYVPLSAYMVCAIIKQGRNEGGWCGLSAEFLRSVGVCSQAKWPQGSRSLSLDTPEVRAEAAKFKITEEWADLALPAYDQNLTMDQVYTCLLNRVPVAGDFNWWSHSVLLCDLVMVDGEICIRFRNSWSDGYGDKGFGILQGQRSIVNGAVALRVVRAAA